MTSFYRTTGKFLSFFGLLLLLASSTLQVSAQENGVDEEFDFGKPRFSRPSSGVGLALGFNLTGLQLSTLDPDLKSDLVLTSLDAYFVRKGLLIGGSWTSSTLYDAPDVYDEFDFSYAGGIVGYEHSLFYGKMTIRPSLFIGNMNVTLIKSRPELTADPILNPDGREVLERLWEDESFMIRPAFGIGWSPIEFLQLRAEVGILYPTGDEQWEDIRKPVYSFQFVFGTNR